MWRAHISFPTISPNLRARNIVWLRGGGTRESTVDHERFEIAIKESPFPRMIEAGETTRRWRFDALADTGGFALLEGLHAAGATDHVVHLTAFAPGHAPALMGASVSFTTQAPDGFSDHDLATFASVVRPVSLAAYRMIVSELTVDLLGAYLGHDAGRRVLGGAIRRGEGHQVSGALMFADLRGFTAATEAAGAAVIPRLGLHLAAMAEPVEEACGEVLKFLGDGLLAAFPVIGGDPSVACGQALAAACEALRRNALVNDAHPPASRLDLDIALHLGEVFYGNIGAASRLDFTVIGPAVNEASRIEGLCGTLGHALLMSAPFAAHCGQPTISLGRQMLRGLDEPRELFALPASGSQPDMSSRTPSARRRETR